MMRDEDPRFRHLKKKVSVFIVVALAMVGVVLFLIGREHDLFIQKYVLRLTVDKGTGFTRGMPVKLSGFRIGRVKSISLNETATVDVLLQIDRRYQKWIHRDSRAKLLKEGLVGDMIVDVTVGSPAMPLLQDMEAIAFEKTKGLDELADEIAGNVQPVLAQVKDIIAYVNDPQGDLKQALRNINQLSADLDGTRRHADEFLVSGKSSLNDSTRRAGAVLGEADSRLKEVAPLLGRLDRTTAVLEQRLPSLLEKADRTMANLEEVSDTAKKTSREVFPRLPLVLDRGEQSLEDTGQVVDALKRTWPISSRIPKPAGTPLIPGDSHE